MKRPRLVWEACAGGAALSLRLQAGDRARPAFSRPGNKWGHADELLSLVALQPGSGAEAYLWTEPEDGLRAWLQCVPDAERLRAVAAVIFGWTGPARELWTRLRDEERAAKTCSEAERVARWVLLTRWSFSERGWEHGYGGPGCRVVRNPAANWTTEQRDAALERPNLIGRLGALRAVEWPAVAVGADARDVTPEEVARWLFVRGNSWKGEGDDWKAPRDPAWSACLTADTLRERIERIERIEWPPVCIGDDCRSVTPAGDDLTDCLVFIDPPYAPDKATGKRRTGYRHNLSRAEVVEIARRFGDAGATVLVSEAAPVEELSGPGWCAEDLRHRKGQARTWGGTPEWVTMNRKPVPGSLFDGRAA